MEQLQSLVALLQEVCHTSNIELMKDMYEKFNDMLSKKKTQSAIGAVLFGQKFQQEFLNLGNPNKK